MNKGYKGSKDKRKRAETGPIGTISEGSRSYRVYLSIYLLLNYFYIFEDKALEG